MLARMDVAGYAYAKLYRALPTPRIRLGGLRPASDALWAGETLKVTAAWWNAYLDKRPALWRKGALRHLQADDVEKVNAAINPANRALFEVMGAEYSPYAKRLGAAALTLSYGLARTLYAGRTHWGEGDLEIVLGLADPIDLEKFEHYAKRYTDIADYYMWEQSPRWWIEEGREWVAKGLVIDGMRWAYADRIRRWEKGEGRDLGEGVGWSLEEGELVTNFRDRLFELGGRLLEAEIITIV